ncbi:unnamed protein product [Orchesella dallaii]|uniref:Uncharacterized protein n=1 Tax=Orchesella dallaii TaxID=48710 RepID=A0ABP1RD39_9HEXA
MYKTFTNIPYNYVQYFRTKINCQLEAYHVVRMKQRIMNIANIICSVAQRNTKLCNIVVALQENWNLFHFEVDLVDVKVAMIICFFETLKCIFFLGAVGG